MQEAQQGFQTYENDQVYYNKNSCSTCCALGPVTFLHVSLLGGLGILKAENKFDI